MSLIYTDGYFRSGSNFLHHSIKLAYSNSQVISEDPAPHLGIGLIRDKNIYDGIAIVVKNPLSQLHSIFSFFKIEDNSLAQIEQISNLKSYLIDLVSNKNDAFIVNFDSLISDHNSVMLQFSQRFPNIGVPNTVSTEDILSDISNSGKVHAVPGFNSRKNNDLLSLIQNSYNDDILELEEIYGQIIGE
jgi:hypothetical protein